MSENVNISFIPKKPLARTEGGRRRPVFGISFLIVVTIAFCMIGVSIFQFFRVEELKKDRVALIEELETFEQDLKKEDIITDLEELKTLARQIDIAQSLLNKHIAPAELFRYIGSITPSGVVGKNIDPVTYSNFSYRYDEQGVQVTMNGEAASYGVLAALAQKYRKTPEIQDYTLGGMSLNSEGGVDFSLTVTLDPSLVSYRKLYGDGTYEAPGYDFSDVGDVNSEAGNVIGIEDNLEE
jgi:hypothetical protein